jgi:cytochrome c-type biogenesis protein CcmH/NrfF
MRRLAALGALLALLVPASWAAAGTPRTTMAKVLPYFMCVTCDIPLANAQSPQAERERAYIQQLIDDGDSFAQIKRVLVAQYGDHVLALPPASGFDVAVYAVPVGVVAALTVLLGILLPRWRRRGPPVADGDEPTLASEDALRLDDELARYDARGAHI